jgi:hypothetical protein
MIKIAFLDIDGTMLSFDTHEMPESTKEALRRMRDAGVLVYVATGRPPYELPENIKHGFEGFDGFDGYLCLSGQWCKDRRGVFRRQPLDKDDVRKMVEVTDSGEVEGLFLLEDHGFVNRITPRIRDHCKFVGLEYEVGDPHELDGDVYQMCLFVDGDDDKFVTEICDHVVTTRWSPAFCDVIPADGGKDVGIEAVLEHYGFTRDEAIAFGDGGNDATMLAYVGTGVAMGNATDEAKAAADYVTDDVDHDGIYNACVKLGVFEG